MRFISTVLLLLTVVLAICVPYFIGHGLAVNDTRWIFTGIGCGIVAAVLVFVGLRIRPRGEATRAPRA